MSATCERCGVDRASTWRGAHGLCGPCYQPALRAGEFGLRDDIAPRPAFVEVDVSWYVDALCAETDPEAFFPEKGGSTKEAKAVCAECLVRAECLTYALDTGQRFGIWGGQSERARRRLLGQAEDDTEEASAA